MKSLLVLISLILSALALTHCSGSGGVRVDGNICPSDMEQVDELKEDDQAHKLASYQTQDMQAGIYKYVSAQIFIKEKKEEKPFLLAVTEKAAADGEEQKSPKGSDCLRNESFNPYDLSIQSPTSLIISETPGGKKSAQIESRIFRIYDNKGKKDKIEFNFNFEKANKYEKAKDAFAEQTVFLYQKTDPNEANIYAFRSKKETENYIISIVTTLKREDIK